MTATQLCRPGQHRCGALALWMFDQPLARIMAAECEARLPRHYWCIRTTLPERFGQPCRLLARGRMNSCLIEFQDGTRHIVSRWSVRKASA
jgi:hypothetical protein